MSDFESTVFEIFELTSSTDKVDMGFSKNYFVVQKMKKYLIR